MAGQINRGTELGEMIYNLAQDTQYKNYVEIGTWNGEGSTQCFRDGLIQREDNWRFFSFEFSRSFYQQAKQFHQEVLDDKFQLIHGCIIDARDIIDAETLTLEAKLLDKDDEQISTLQEWRNNEIRICGECENKIHLLDDIDIDVLLLDGGEHTTKAEFSILKPRSKIIILDDTKEMKTNTIHAELLNDVEWECFVSSDGRNGFSIHKRK
jgi:hypothetical protein